MSKDEQKDNSERFQSQVLRLGGKKPICEWNKRSGIVGFEYDGQVYRYRVAPTNGPLSDAEILDKMIIACQWALTELTGKRAGITRNNGN